MGGHAHISFGSRLQAPLPVADWTLSGQTLRRHADSICRHEKQGPWISGIRVWLERGRRGWQRGEWKAGKSPQLGMDDEKKIRIWGKRGDRPSRRANGFLVATDIVGGARVQTIRTGWSSVRNETRRGFCCRTPRRGLPGSWSATGLELYSSSAGIRAGGMPAVAANA
jgi:hypothetical protein